MVIDLQVYRYSVNVDSYITSMLYYSWSGVDNSVFLHYNSTFSHSIHVHVLQFSFTRLYITSFKKKNHIALLSNEFDVLNTLCRVSCSDWVDKNLKCNFIILGLNFKIPVSKNAFCHVKLGMMCPPPLLPYMSHTLFRMKSVHRIKVDNLDLYNFNF